MPGKTKRKILQQGCSLTVSIPADYRRYHNLKPGKEVVVLYDSLLLIIPEDRRHILEDPEKKKLIDKLLE